jgi:aspartate/methionine/tyrosine aminotransferase
MEECINWCREREVHLISDEIYAGSVYRQMSSDGTPTFVSAMSLASKHEHADSGLGLGPYIHLVYALSKDFALSGLRVGVAYTENTEILFALQKLNDFCQISSHTQLLVERMLSAQMERNGVTESFVDIYLESNNHNIRSRSDKLVKCLNELDIPHLYPDSGLFLWMDLREFLPGLSSMESPDNESLESKEQRERVLYLSLMKEYGLLFTPGMSMRNERAGFFRCVFTAASEEEFELGLVRIRKFVDSNRR